MALEGSLSDFGLADILQLIYFQKKTGILTVTGARDKVRLLFSDGNVISAESRKRTEENRLGRILLKKGLITEGDLHAALDEQKARGGKIGDILISSGVIGTGDIRTMLVSQVTETVVQLFSWKEGAYEFRPDPVRAGNDMPITLDTQHLLMEGLRIVDEWSLMEGRITLDTVFCRTGAADVPLNPDEEKVLSYVDGENDASILIDLSGIDDFEASKILLSFLDRGIIKPVETAPVTRETVAVAPKTREISLTRFMPPLVVGAALLVLLALPFLPGRGFLTGKAVERFRTESDLHTLRFLAEAHRYRTGSYPPDISQMGGGTDAWGRTYRYRAENDTLTIVSAGPDGLFDTGDDLY